MAEPLILRHGVVGPLRECSPATGDGEECDGRRIEILPLTTAVVLCEGSSKLLVRLRDVVA